MPRRKRNATGEGTTVSATTAVPGGGTQSDLQHLSSTLNLPLDAVTTIMSCDGKGVRSSSRRSAGGDEAAAAAAPPAGVDASMMNVWGDFMSEEMNSAPAAAPAAATSASSSAAAPASKPATESSNDSKPSSKPTAAAEDSSGPRSYILPIPPRMHLATSGKKKKTSSEDEEYEVPTPGLLAQTGTLDASVPGRSSISKSLSPHELMAPTLLFPSIFGSKKIAFITTSPLSCHSIAITEEGKAYGWGRNETGQLGLGFTSAVVPIPTLLTVNGEESLKFVGAACGKYHSILVGSNGLAYASGGNICGQLGINNSNARGVDRWRKCVVMGQISGEEEEDEEGKIGSVKIVQASAGENISALLSSAGHLYTTGSSEFGQLGNGETGEYIIAAGKLGFANCAKFIRRSVFVQSESDRDGKMSNMMTSGGMDSAGKVKCVNLDDCGTICLANVSCGKNHIVAVEAPSIGRSQVPRVFSWGCGDYGCLGHGIQADEYTPRLVGSMRGPIFANNHPVEVVAGSNCTVVKTRHGHVYYVGKHKQAGEATMRPTLVDALANNGHVVTCLGAGAQTVFCSTKNGVTVSWGHGDHGQLGYGKDDNKSSSKPKFVNGLDSCLVTAVACGMGHTLFIIRDDDEEDKKALKKVGKVEEEDVSEFVEKIKGKEVDADADGGEPAKKKQKGKGKK